MTEFFRGWRRKVGCVTLVMALAVAFLWLRSIFVWDVVSIHYGDTLQELYCEEGAVLWATEHCLLGPTCWFQGCQQEMNNEYQLLVPTSDLLWNIRGSPDARHLIVYYWQPLCPLTILSAYLLLWKPRK